MPTYDYKCDGCGHAFEQVQSIKAESLKKCPACGKQTLRRLIGTGGGLIFKGSGFYITDYRDSAYKDKAKADSGAADSKGEGSKGEGKSESKDSNRAGEAGAASKSDSSAPSAATGPAKTGPSRSEAAPAPKPADKPAGPDKK